MTEGTRSRAPSGRSPRRSRTDHSTGTYQRHGCHIYAHVGCTRDHENECVDTPQRKPRRPERRNTPNMIIVVVKGRERGCAEYDSRHFGKRGIGRPKVGRLEWRHQRMDDLRRVCRFTICFTSSALSTSSSVMSASRGRGKVGCGASSRSTIIQEV